MCVIQKTKAVEPSWLATSAFYWCNYLPTTTDCQNTLITIYLYILCHLVVVPAVRWWLLLAYCFWASDCYCLRPKGWPHRKEDTCTSNPSKMNSNLRNRTCICNTWKGRKQSGKQDDVSEMQLSPKSQVCSIQSNLPDSDFGCDYVQRGKILDLILNNPVTIILPFTRDEASLKCPERRLCNAI